MAPPRPLPHLDQRRTALLAGMGVAPWWVPPAPWLPPQEPAAIPPAAPVASPQVPVAPAAARPPQPPPPPASPPPSEVPPPPQAPLPAAPGSEEGAPAPAGALDTLDWQALEAAIHACQRCGLGACRQRAVPGVGDRQPTWLIVGEAPGEEEDRQGEPFVGRAGHLLDRMLTALALRRGQGVYIANVLKCRPPRNRNPQPQEIAQCAPYLWRQIALLQPRIILALGRFAAQTLLAEGGCLPPQELAATPLGRLRGRVFTARLGTRTVPVVVSYHPAYLLRNPADKAKAWADLCLAAQTLESAVSTQTVPQPF